MKIKFFVPISVGAALMLIGFQNCAPNNSFQLPQSDLEGTTSLLSQDEAVKATAVLDDGTGFIFSGVYGVNPNDPTGNQVCDYAGYPRKKNCRTNADGMSQGAAIVKTTRLSASASIHKVRMQFQSNGFLTKNPEAHMALGLRGRITKNAQGNPVAVNGRGMIIGHLGGDSRNKGNPTCANSMLQIESYSGDAGQPNSGIPANQIFSETCTDSVFKEGQWYTLEMYVSRDRKIGFKVFDSSGELLDSSIYQDAYDYVDLNLTDFFVAHVFESNISSPSGNWNFIVKGITLSEVGGSIESQFSRKPISLFLGSAVKANNYVVTVSNLNNPGVFIGNFSSSRRRVFGCANPKANVDSGAVCNKASDFREISFSGDSSFSFSNKKLKILAGPLANYPRDIYKLVIRTNPESAYNQVSVVVDNR